jgi:hypothetical protein
VNAEFAPYLAKGLAEFHDDGSVEVTHCVTLIVPKSSVIVAEQTQVEHATAFGRKLRIVPLQWPWEGEAVAEIA